MASRNEDNLPTVETSIERLDDLRIAETRRVNEIMLLRADYTEKLAIAESKRIDSLRSVDVNAVSVAAERASAQAQVLANQVSTSADTLRSLVAATATTIAQQLATLTTQLTDRISALEKSQYTISGTSGVTTPAIEARFESINKTFEHIGKTLEQLDLKISSLQDTRSVSSGKGAGVSMSWAFIVGGIGVLGAIIALLLNAIRLFSSNVV